MTYIVKSESNNCLILLGSQKTLLGIFVIIMKYILPYE